MVGMNPRVRCALRRLLKMVRDGCEDLDVMEEILVEILEDDLDG